MKERSRTCGDRHNCSCVPIPSSRPNGWQRSCVGPSMYRSWTALLYWQPIPTGTRNRARAGDCWRGSQRIATSEAIPGSSVHGINQVGTTLDEVPTASVEPLQRLFDERVRMPGVRLSNPTCVSVHLSNKRMKEDGSCLLRMPC